MSILMFTHTTLGKLVTPGNLHSCQEEATAPHMQKLKDLAGIILDCFRNAGFSVQWSGTADHSIVIKVSHLKQCCRCIAKPRLQATASRVACLDCCEVIIWAMQILSYTSVAIMQPAQSECHGTVLVVHRSQLLKESTPMLQ